MALFPRTAWQWLFFIPTYTAHTHTYTHVVYKCIYIYICVMDICLRTQTRWLYTTFEMSQTNINTHTRVYGVHLYLHGHIYTRIMYILYYILGDKDRYIDGKYDV